MGQNGVSFVFATRVDIGDSFARGRSSDLERERSP